MGGEGARNHSCVKHLKGLIKYQRSCCCCHLICLTLVLREIAADRMKSATSSCDKRALNFFDLEVLTCFGGSYTSRSHMLPSCSCDTDLCFIHCGG